MTQAFLLRLIGDIFVHLCSHCIDLMQPGGLLKCRDSLHTWLVGLPRATGIF